MYYSFIYLTLNSITTGEFSNLKIFFIINVFLNIFEKISIKNRVYTLY